MKHVFALIAMAALLAGCSKTSSTTTEQATAAAADGAAASSPSATSASGGSAVAGTSSVIPVYPGATRDAGQSTSFSDGGDTTKVDYYNTKDDGPTVAAWYKAHVPAEWTGTIGEPGKKIAGTFSSPDADQIVMVTSYAGGTVIQISAKTASK